MVSVQFSGAIRMIGRDIIPLFNVERWARGAMGMVYKAQDQKLDRPGSHQVHLA